MKVQIDLAADTLILAFFGQERSNMRICLLVIVEERGIMIVDTSLALVG